MVNCYGYCHLAGVYLPRVWWWTGGHCVEIIGYSAH